MKRKITIMKVRPEVSDGEIQSYMNFDDVLIKHTEAVALHKNKTLYRAIGLGSAMGILFFVWLYWFSSSEPADKPNKRAPQENAIPKSKPKDTATSQQQPVGEGGALKKEEGILSAVSPRKKTTGQTPVDTLTAKTKNIPTEAIYKQAEPVDGYPALYEYFGRELKYPVESMGDSIQGVVIAVFTINKQGVPEKISIEQSLGPAFDRETLRVITSMPAWKAATYNQKPVNSRISLPLTFQIKKIKTR